MLTTQYDLVSSDEVRTRVIGFHTSPKLTVGDYEGDLGFFVCDTGTCLTPESVVLTYVHYKVTVTPAPPAAALTPSAINITVVQGDPATALLDAALNSSLSAISFATVYTFTLDDPRNKFDSSVGVSLKSAGLYGLTLRLLPIADSPGIYTGTLSLHICYGSCTDSYDVPGSPINIPYTITVMPFVPLAEIPTTTGLPEWETYQGNAGHTGFVPTTLDTTTFKSKWTWVLPASGSFSRSLGSITTGSGKAVFAVSGNYPPDSIVALDETDGTTVWKHDFALEEYASAPAVFGGRAFVVSGSDRSHRYLQALSMSDGASVFQSTIDTPQYAYYMAPTVKNGYVYTPGGVNSGVYAFNATTGVQIWRANAFSSYDLKLWTPAVDASYVYAHAPVLGAERVEVSSLFAFNLVGGSKALAVVANAAKLNGLDEISITLGNAPVLPGDSSVIAIDRLYDSISKNLVRYSVTSQSVLWNVNGNFGSNPVTSAGIIYLLSLDGNQLEARDETNGSVLWTWQPASSIETITFGNLVLTNNMIFLSTSAATYAVDLTTHQAVWSTPHVGSLALSSNKVLYISSQSEQTVYAYQLN